MPRSFDIVVDSPASVEQVHAAFSSEDYWLARHAAFDVASTLDSLVVDADGTVTVHATQYLGRRLLPASVAKFVPAELKILHSETWRPDTAGQVRGQVDVAAPASLGSGHLKAWLAPVDSTVGGSRLRFAATVAVKIPLVGGRIEKVLGVELADNIQAIQQFTTEWIDDHG